ncbi:DUF6252 family protein [Flavobacterium sp. XGLA_31]|uniref:DUF6252 family protein n=1 Tax=Flavobacterium sp. XGLA_31 TaxID=3447666 RepID=UPI003F2BC7FA
MKKFLSLFILALAFSSCQEDLKTNNPGFQALKDDMMWRGTDARAYISTTGELRIEALNQYDQVTLSTESADEDVYVLGTTDSANSASYFSSFNDLDLEYGTIPVSGPVYSVVLIGGGTGYTPDCDMQPNGLYTCDSAHNTTGGSGTGLTLAIGTNGLGGVNKIVKVVSRGNGYLPGDIVTVTSGDLNCQVKVVNVETSNGEIEITDYDPLNMTVTGTFKFNAVNVDNNPFGLPVVNFQYGEFYKIPIYPDSKK